MRPMTFHRRVVVKVSIKKISGGGLAALRKHVDYIQRDGTDERGEPAKLYGRNVDPEQDAEVDGIGSKPSPDFVSRCQNDRHGFRIIISPEDGAQLQDLSSFTRDVVSQMEIDLGTKLDWVAADHYDTGQPHTHLLIRGVRDNGNDLVMPREYVSRTLRETAQHFVELELGPVSQMEGRVRLAKTVDAAGHTALDTSLAKQLSDGVVDTRRPVQSGRVWQRQLEVRRLKRLSQMGLAERLGSGRWKVDSDFGEKLRQISERKQIVAAIHRTMHQSGVEIGQPLSAECITERNMFDPNRLGASRITGIVRQFGRPDDTKPGGFVLIEDLKGSPIFSKVADDETFESLKQGQVITLKPHAKGPRNIDRSIAAFASKNQGIYSEASHATQSDRVSPAYAQAHVRRLEALRRQKLVTRKVDRTWSIPENYLERAALYEADRARRLPAGLERSSHQTLRQMESARGATWLDSALMKDGMDETLGSNFKTAFEKRLESLRGMGFEPGPDGKLSSQVIENLQTMDLRSAAKSLEGELGKSYADIGDARKVDGVYLRSVDRPSGKFAVIERSREFTLVPWRPVMEKRLGKSISGRISAGGISWDVTGRMGPSR